MEEQGMMGMIGEKRDAELNGTVWLTQFFVGGRGISPLAIRVSFS